MATNISSLSAAKLKELKLGEKIIIRHAETQEQQEAGASRIIFEQFSRRAATAFSTKWASTFPPINKMTIAEMQKPKQTSTTIIGGHVPTIQKILVWILSCCDGSGMKPYPIFSVRPYSTYFDIKETADLIGVSIISKEMQRRMNEILSHQIHSDDVREMYARLPRDHPVIKTIVNDIAERTWKRELVAAGAYRALRKEMPHFDHDINVLLDSRREELRLARVKEMELRKAERARKTRGKKNVDSAAGGKKKVPQLHDAASKISPSTTQPQIQSRSRASAQAQLTPTKSNLPATINDGDATSAQSNTEFHNIEHTLRPAPVTTKIRCPIARKAQRGRPAYVSLSLAEVGVSKEDFTGSSFQQSRSTRSKTQQATKGLISNLKKQTSETKLNDSAEAAEQSQSQSQTQRSGLVGSAGPSTIVASDGRDGIYSGGVSETNTTATVPTAMKKAVTSTTPIPQPALITATATATAAAAAAPYPTQQPTFLTYGNANVNANVNAHTNNTSASTSHNSSDNLNINIDHSRGLDINESMSLNHHHQHHHRPHIVVSFPTTDDWIVV